MPKDVDHEARREELIESVWRLVARDGMEAATIRGIAMETGWSSGSLAHYFTDKDDILTSALNLAYDRIDRRVEERLAGLTGMAGLRELILDSLPLDPVLELEIRFLMNYSSRLTRRSVEVTRPLVRGPRLIGRLKRLILEAQDDGEIPATRRAEDIAELLYAFIDGLSLHHLLDPERLPTSRVAALVDDELQRLRMTPPSAARP